MIKMRLNKRLRKMNPSAAPKTSNYERDTVFGVYPLGHRLYPQESQIVPFAILRAVDRPAVPLKLLEKSALLCAVIPKSEHVIGLASSVKFMKGKSQRFAKG